MEEQAIDNSKAENLRKLILATSKDIRVLLVKLADRLHNMRTIETARDENKKIEKAKETMEIYAPLADRMGMNRIRDELKDLSFSILNREARKLILDRLSLIKSKKENTFKMISDELNQILKQYQIKLKLPVEKHLFNMEKDTIKTNFTEQITDIIGFRVIVKNTDDCYKALGVFHSKYASTRKI